MKTFINLCKEYITIYGYIFNIFMDIIALPYVIKYIVIIIPSFIITTLLMMYIFCDFIYKKLIPNRKEEK